RLASPLVALIAVPVVAALAAGFGLATATFIVTGVQQIAPVAAMFVFAILYFGIITDAGTLEPVINAILRAVGARPARVVVRSAHSGVRRVDGRRRQLPAVDRPHDPRVRVAAHPDHGALPSPGAGSTGRS